MNEFGLAFHHFGLAVRSPDQAFGFLAALGYQQGETVFDPLQSVNLAMCYHADMPDVEVIWPSAEASPIDAMLKRRDSLIYHLCYTAADPADALLKMEKAGLAVLPAVEPRPAILFGGHEVSFYFVAGFGLIELIHCNPADATSLKT
ncbi:MAG: VOC family protein [Methylococcales bacterium]|nr:VOC family protein [Methylococcales bacterium]